MSNNTEIVKAIVIRKLGKLLPIKFRFRFYKKLYNYESNAIKGFKLVVPYLQNKSFLINTKDLICWNIFFFGEYEADTNYILKKYIKEDFHVLEAGANNGTESILLGTLAPKGKVYAFEPIPHVYRELDYNIKINKLTNVVSTYQMALGDENKNVIFNVLPEDFCNQGMASKYIDSGNSTKLNVTQITLDKFIEDEKIEKIDFLKMDIQGAELDLLKGGNKFIDIYRPIIFTEASDGMTNTLEMYRILTEKKYNTYLIQKNGSLKKLKENVIEGNWLSIPNEKDK